jgi:hypothetical protein
MEKCKKNHDLKISNFKMPQPDPEEIKKFIECFGNKMKDDQVKILQLMADNIYRFHLESHNMECKNKSGLGPVNTCIFSFEHENTKGEITITF